MIQARVKKRLGDFQLDSEIADDKFICLTGKNGSGKTTLLNILAGILKPDEGFVRLDSEDVTKTPLDRRGITLVASDSYIPHLAVEKHLIWGAKARGIEVNRDRLNKIKESLGIASKGKVKDLSLGMRERVSIATALVSTPKLILIDEAFANIDDRERFIASFKEFTDNSNIDVIFTSQMIEDAKIADHQYRMDSGKSTKLF